MRILNDDDDDNYENTIQTVTSESNGLNGSANSCTSANNNNNANSELVNGNATDPDKKPTENDNEKSISKDDLYDVPVGEFPIYIHQTVTLFFSFSLALSLFTSRFNG